MLFAKRTFFTVKNLVTLILAGLMGLSVAEASPASGALQCRSVLRFLSDTQITSTITALAKLRLEIDRNKINGNADLQVRLLGQQYRNKEDDVAKLLQDNGTMTKWDLTAAIKREIARLQEVSKDVQIKKVQSQQEVQKLLELDYYRKQMIFHDLPEGLLQYGPNVVKIQVEKFAMMATPVTQKMWALIWAEAGKTDPKLLAPSSHPFTGKLNIKGQELEMNPDHPVDRFDASMMNQFLIALNTLALSSDPQVLRMLKELIPDHQEFDIYDLPTDQQWEYVRTNMGKIYNKFFDRDDANEVSLYGWVRNEDSLEIQPVAMLQPRVINGKPFYDLEGNALEYTKTTTPDQQNVVRGLTQISERTRMPLNSAFPGVGFRLIRLRR